MRVLIIDHNPTAQTALANGLREHGFAVDIAQNGYDGEAHAVIDPADIILLEPMLPDRKGSEVCRNLRRRKCATPIIILTGSFTMNEKIDALDAGADGYIIKPFAFDELLARMRAMLRRGKATESRVLRHADIELDLYTRCARRGERSFELSNREFALLEYLMRNPNRVLSRIQISEKVWSTNCQPESNVIDVYVSLLRRKLSLDLLHTVRGSGYRFSVEEGVAA